MNVFKTGLAVLLAVSPFFLSANKNHNPGGLTACEKPLIKQVSYLLKEPLKDSFKKRASLILENEKANCYLPALQKWESRGIANQPLQKWESRGIANQPLQKWESKGIANQSNYLIASNEEKLQNVIEEQIKNHQKATRSQEKVSALAEETEDIINEYEIVLGQIENTRSYNTQLKKLIADQKSEMTSIRTQIIEVKQTSKNIIPLMLKMIKSLEKFITLDIPFLLEERKKRVAEIKKIMDRANISISEKYRKLMSAYQIENEYGRTIEAYQGFQDVDGKKISVNYLRVGRIALIYQSLDKKKQAYWNKNKKQWVVLPSRYSRSVEEGLKVARKQQAPTLLTVPIPAPIKTAIASVEKEVREQSAEAQESKEKSAEEQESKEKSAEEQESSEQAQESKEKSAEEQESSEQAQEVGEKEKSAKKKEVGK